MYTTKKNIGRYSDYYRPLFVYLQ